MQLFFFFFPGADFLICFFSSQKHCLHIQMLKITSQQLSCLRILCRTTLETLTVSIPAVLSTANCSQLLMKPSRALQLLQCAYNNINIADFYKLKQKSVRQKPNNIFKIWLHLMQKINQQALKYYFEKICFPEQNDIIIYYFILKCKK